MQIPSVLSSFGLLATLTFSKIPPPETSLQKLIVDQRLTDYFQVSVFILEDKKRKSNNHIESNDVR